MGQLRDLATVRNYFRQCDTEDHWVKIDYDDIMRVYRKADRHAGGVMVKVMCVLAKGGVTHEHTLAVFHGGNAKGVEKQLNEHASAFMDGFASHANAFRVADATPVHQFINTQEES